MEFDEVMCYFIVKFEDCGQEIVSVKAIDENLSVIWFFENKFESDFVLKSKKLEFIKMIQEGKLVPFKIEEINNIRYTDIDELIKKIASHAICFDEKNISFSDLPEAVAKPIEFPWQHALDNQIFNPDIKLIVKHKNAIEKYKDEEHKGDTDFLLYCHKIFMQTIKKSNNSK